MSAPVTPKTLTDAMVRELNCAICGNTWATCIGRYDLPEDAPAEPACDSCCGHGCEYGKCYLLRDDDGALNPEAEEWICNAINRAKESGK